MKKFFIFMLAAALFFPVGCRSAKSIVSDREDTAYIQFVSAAKYDSVSVVIDGTVTIIAGVNDINQRKTKNDRTYAVTPGKHILEVSLNGQKILTKEIFVSAQEIRYVELP